MTGIRSSRVNAAPSPLNLCPVRRLWTLLPVVVLLSGAATPSPAWSQVSAADLVNQGVRLFNDSNDHEGARAKFEAAVRADPSYARAHANLANALRVLDRHNEARAALDQALALRPDYPYARRVLSWIANREGLAADDPAEKLVKYSEVVELNPEWRTGHANRAYALYKLERLDEARRAAERARELDPDYEYAEKVLGWIAAAERRAIAAERRRQAAADRRYASRPSRPRSQPDRSDEPPRSVLDEISDVVTMISEPLQQELGRAASEQEAELRRAMEQATEEARRREEAERRRREAEARRRREQARRQAAAAGPTRGGVQVGPTPEERRRAELEKQRRREEEARRQREERRRAAERERQRRAEERRRQEEAARRASYPPACRNIKTREPGIEGDFTWRLERCLSAHALMENTRTVTITVHDACEVLSGKQVEFNFEPEGAFRQGNVWTGAWIGGSIRYSGGVVLPTNQGNATKIFWQADRSPYRFQLSYDTRRHRRGVMSWYWKVTYPDGRYEFRTVSVPLTRSGAYDYRGNYTGSVPSCR